MQAFENYRGGDACSDEVSYWEQRLRWDILGTFKKACEDSGFLIA